MLFSYFARMASAGSCVGLRSQALISTSSKNRWFKELNQIKCMIQLCTKRGCFWVEMKETLVSMLEYVYSRSYFLARCKYPGIFFLDSQLLELTYNNSWATILQATTHDARCFSRLLVFLILSHSWRKCSQPESDFMLENLLAFSFSWNSALIISCKLPKN